MQSRSEGEKYFYSGLKFINMTNLTVLNSHKERTAKFNLLLPPPPQSRWLFDHRPPHFKNCSAGPGHCLQQPLVKAGDPFICFRNTKRFPCLHSLIQIREGLEEFDTIIRLRVACCYGGGSAKREDKALSSLVGIKDNTYTYLKCIPPNYLNNCFAIFMLNNLNSLLCIILGVLSQERSTLIRTSISRKSRIPIISSTCACLSILLKFEVCKTVTL